jgi:hypothetical protein
MICSSLTRFPTSNRPPRGPRSQIQYSALQSILPLQPGAARTHRQALSLYTRTPLPFETAQSAAIKRPTSLLSISVQGHTRRPVSPAATSTVDRIPPCVDRVIVVRHRAPRRLRTGPYCAMLANIEVPDAASRRDAALRMNSPLRDRQCRAAFRLLEHPVLLIVGGRVASLRAASIRGQPLEGPPSSRMTLLCHYYRDREALWSPGACRRIK